MLVGQDPGSPQCSTAIRPQAVESPRGCQRLKTGAAQVHTSSQVGLVQVGTVGATLSDDGLSNPFSQPLDRAQTEPHREVVVDVKW